MSFLSSLFSGGKVGQPTAPTFQPDPLVNTTDTELNNFGSNVLQGILPTQYQDLIQTNSPQFQAMLNNSNAQIQGSALSTGAMQGNARSGAAQAGATQAIASNTANLSYQDLLNTQLNQKAILGSGLASIQAANTGALTNQGQTNNFALGVYGTQMQGYNTATNYNQNMAQLALNAAGGLSQGIGSLASSIPYMGGGGTGYTGANEGEALGAMGANAGVDTYSSQIDQLLANGAGGLTFALAGV